MMIEQTTNLYRATAGWVVVSIHVDPQSMLIGGAFIRLNQNHGSGVT